MEVTGMAGQSKKESKEAEQTFKRLEKQSQLELSGFGATMI